MAQDSLLQCLERAFIDAMKSRSTVRVATLRLVRAALKNREIERRGALEEGDVLQVLTTLAKQRRESIEQFRAGGRDDLVEREEAELSVLEEFLPAAMDAAELEGLVRETIAAVGAQGVKDLGRVMSALMPRVAGRADGREVNRLVRTVLEGGEAV